MIAGGGVAGREGLVERARDWRWSSVRAHLAARDAGLTSIAPVLERFPRFADIIAQGPDAAMFERLPQLSALSPKFCHRNFNFA
jgi:hypothetical protein